jgi:hypothetical protein
MWEVVCRLTALHTRRQKCGKETGWHLRHPQRDVECDLLSSAVLNRMSPLLTMLVQGHLLSSAL